MGSPLFETKKGREQRLKQESKERKKQLIFEFLITVVKAILTK